MGGDLQMGLENAAHKARGWGDSPLRLQQYTAGKVPAGPLESDCLGSNPSQAAC